MMRSKLFLLVSLIVFSMIFSSCFDMGGSKRSRTTSPAATADLCDEVSFSSADCACYASADAVQVYCQGLEDACEMLTAIPSGYICENGFINLEGGESEEDPEEDPNEPNDPAGQVSSPTFNYNNGTFNSAINVTISSSTPGAVIKYRLGGSDPTCTYYQAYSSPIQIASGTTIIKAIACKDDMEDSPVVGRTYTIQSSSISVAAPTFSKQGGSYDVPQTIYMSTTTSAAQIRYVVGNASSSISCSTGSIYSTTNPALIQNEGLSVLKAIACKNGVSSSIASVSYTIDPEKVSNPVFNPSPGTHYTDALGEYVYVSISSPTQGSFIKYTIDGNDPDCFSSGTVLGSSSSIRVPTGSTRTIKAIACPGYSISEMVESNVVVGTFTVALNPVPNPKMSTGTTSGSIPMCNSSNVCVVANRLPVYLGIENSSSYSGVSLDIYYTTNGTNPVCYSSSKYVSALNFSPPSNGLPVTVKAITCRTIGGAQLQSDTVSKQYTILYASEGGNNPPAPFGTSYSCTSLVGQVRAPSNCGMCTSGPQVSKCSNSIMPKWTCEPCQ